MRSARRWRVSRPGEIDRQFPDWRFPAPLRILCSLPGDADAVHVLSIAFVNRNVICAVLHLSTVRTRASTDAAQGRGMLIAAPASGR